MTSFNYESFIGDFLSGKEIRAAEFFGAHSLNGGLIFRVWAPHAREVFLAGDFNAWSNSTLPMNRLDGGVWECFVPDLPPVTSYKYVIKTNNGQTLWKADPYAFFAELRPETASRSFPIEGYKWRDGRWLSSRRRNKVYGRPLNIYEVHLASWMLNDDGSFLSYRQAAEKLIPYVCEMGFTHIEFMPLSEYPYDASWGYQCTGYFAATSRYGTPHDLMYLIDECHRAGIGVIMDWVPAHFPKDAFGLYEFDGTRLYEDSDPKMAEHPSWGTRIFDYAKGGVRSFLISSALFWLEKYHIDGLRVDAVASMLYLDYDRKDGKFRRNKYGGNGNLDAVDLIRALNSACFSYDDSVMMIAEESTAWPLVTAPADVGGLGFNLKWNMGWMNDTQRYLKTDPYFRSGCHNELTFSIMYAFSENFILPLSHDEVVHMKAPFFNKSSGTREQRAATTRAFWAYMLAHPGKKLMFMGAELGQETEWDFASELPWKNLQYDDKKALNTFFAEANAFYKSNSPLWSIDFDGEGFSWICADERDRNVLGFLRRDKAGKEIAFVCNFSGAGIKSFRLGVPNSGNYAIIMSTDSRKYGGVGDLETGDRFKSEPVPHHSQNRSITIDIPPLSAIFLSTNRKTSPQRNNENNL